MLNKRRLNACETRSMNPNLGNDSTPHTGSGCASRSSCFRLALVDSRGQKYSGEVQGLLRGRLQVVSIIILIPALYYLARSLLQPPFLWEQPSATLLFRLAVILCDFAFAALLWSRRELTLSQLRGCELAMFGLTAFFFAWLQYEDYSTERIYLLAATGMQSEMMRYIVRATTTRWFFLIVIYGVFIPNTWRRCAVLVGSVAVLSLLLTLVASYRQDRLDEGIAYGLGDMAVMLFTAITVAIFGCYRIHVLHEQAFEAQQLGQYRLKKRLGSGGMGEVYLAEHSLLRRPCAVKLIRPKDATDPTVLQRFEREVQAMARLTHWNTVEIFDYGHGDDGTFYYVMEYLPGETLDRLVARTGPMPPARVIHFLRQVCWALREAHAAGMLHRDIKPSNMIVGERGGINDVVKLLDFGLVQCIQFGPDPGKLTVQGTVVGSPPYMSPEQALVRRLDPRSDLYSVGAVAYFLLTGQAPFPRDTAMAMLVAHAYEKPVPPAELRLGVPDDLQEIVLRCLEKKPEDRFTSAESLEKALAKCRDANQWTEADAVAAWHNSALAPEEVAEIKTEQLAHLPVAAP